MTKPKYLVIKDLKFAPIWKEENILSLLEYQPSDDDIFIVTYPKCGTTWTQQIVCLIQNNGQYPEGGIWKHSPFLEARGIGILDGLEKPYSLKTHIEAGAHPWNPNAKYIVTLRNPKDVVVSYFYHHKLDCVYGVEDISFNDFFEHWINGEVECGSYFEWVKSWWSRRQLCNVLVITYEDMKYNLMKEIAKIATFLNIEVTDELIKNIASETGFDTMKTYLNEKYFPNFLRKGVVGDWKNHLNSEQSQRIEEMFHEHFDGSGLEHLWRNYEVFLAEG